MLPDFPEIKRKFIEVVNKYLRHLTRQDPLFSKIHEEHHFEGDKMSSRTVSGEIDESGYKKFSSEFTISREDIISKGPKAFIENIEKVAEDLKKHKAELLFGKLNEATEKTGNIVDLKGQPFTFDHYLEIFEKIWIDFDDEGNPYMPSLVIPPKDEPMLKGKLLEWSANPECKKKFDKLIEKKKAEWYDRESHRKLVD